MLFKLSVTLFRIHRTVILYILVKKAKPYRPEISAASVAQFIIHGSASAFSLKLLYTCTMAESTHGSGLGDLNHEKLVMAR